MQTTSIPFLRACTIVGSQAAMARLLGLSPSMVNQLAKGRRPVPVEHCLAIETATLGQVTRRDLCSKDWDRIWPELAVDAAALQPITARQGV